VGFRKILGEIMYNTGNSSKNVTTTSIVDGTISNADVDGSAAIATSKLSGAVTSITSHGLASSATTDTTNASNIGSGTLSNSRLSLDISNSDVNASAAIVQSKLATLAITDSEVANDALSGDKIDGGTISDFASTGIDDNANANAITIDVNERVVIGGSDSSVTPNASADDLMVESSGATGITIAAGTGSTARLAFADSGDSLIGRITYDNVSNDMSFGTGGVDDRVIIQSTGGISFNGDSAAANALDDYEEGTWTASINGASAAAAQTARYTKIGNVVTAYAYISSITNTNNSTQFQITGLPFATAAASLASGVTIGWSNAADLSNWRGITNSSSNNFYFSDAVTGATKTHANAQSAGITHLIFTITYRSA
jgi:hypothetical protein